MIIQINPEIVSYDKSIQGLCRREYYGHKKGCPNYGVKQGCPPGVPLINEVLDFEKDLFLIYTEFDVEAHAQRMWQMHPNWTERQAYNCRYWQPGARKSHRQEEAKAVQECLLTKIVDGPEAHGVDVIALFDNIGMALEWPPRKITRLVSLGGHAIEQ